VTIRCRRRWRGSRRVRADRIARSGQPAGSRSADLTAKHGDFVAQDEDLEVFGCGVAGELPQPAEHCDTDQVQQSELHGPRSCHKRSQPTKPQVTTPVWVLARYRQILDRHHWARQGSPRLSLGDHHDDDGNTTLGDIRAYDRSRTDCRRYCLAHQLIDQDSTSARPRLQRWLIASRSSGGISTYLGRRAAFSMTAAGTVDLAVRCGGGRHPSLGCCVGRVHPGNAVLPAVTSVGAGLARRTRVTRARRSAVGRTT